MGGLSLDIELIALISMLGVFLLSNLLFKLPVSISMILGAISGAVVGGEGIPLRHLFEGTFAYVDTCLIISTAMLFMTAVQESGAMARRTVEEDQEAFLRSPPEWKGIHPSFQS